MVTSRKEDGAELETQGQEASWSGGGGGDGEGRREVERKEQARFADLSKDMEP